MKILLLGGTSFFGIDIAKLLNEEGHDVTLFTRGNRKPKELEGFNFFKGIARKVSTSNARTNKSPPTS